MANGNINALLIIIIACLTQFIIYAMQFLNGKPLYKESTV